jgi:ribosomal protein S6
MATDKKTAENESLNRVYEVGFLLVPGLAEERVGSEVTKIKDAIEKAGGLMISEGFPSLRKLTYTIAKRVEAKIERYNEGYFGWIKYEASTDSAEALHKMLTANTNVIRFMLISTVRENTLYERPKRITKASSKKEDDSNAFEMSEEELDQTIEELVIE